MDITHHIHADLLELRLVGRLDATWAGHVGDTIEAAIRGGAHRIVVNLAHVDYISSLGISVLVKYYKQLSTVNGSLAVSEPSTRAFAVLRAAGLAGVLVTASGSVAAAPVRGINEFAREGTTYQVFPQSVSTTLSCRAIGTPAKLQSHGFADEDCRGVDFPMGTFGLGLGAFGEGFDDCRHRFGEFIAAGGSALTLPTSDPHADPDYVVSEGALIPRVQMLYGLVGTGEFPTMVRFDADPTGAGTVGLSALIDALFEVTAQEAMAFVVVAEIAGLVGATLRRSPVGAAATLGLPGVRDWVSFTTERTSERALGLLVGVVLPSERADLAPFFRPLRAGGNAHAHIHGAAFPYRPVQRGELPFRTAVHDLLAAAVPTQLFHVMADTRPFEGVGETDLVRGACWVGPVQTLTLG